MHEVGTELFAVQEAKRRHFGDNVYLVDCHSGTIDRELCGKLLPTDRLVKQGMWAGIITGATYSYGVGSADSAGHCGRIGFGLQ